MKNDSDILLKKQFLSAAEGGDIELIKSLIGQGVDINAKDNKNEWTALHIASSFGHLNVVEYLVEQGALIDLVDYQEFTSLLHAALSGKILILEYLINQGANINSIDNMGRSALHLAALTGELDVVSYLVEKGLDVKAKNIEGKTPLDKATENDREDVVCFLLAFEDQQLLDKEILENEHIPSMVEF